MAALLAVRNVVKRYGPVRALAGVDLDVRAGEVVALVGDNGAGKSTLIKVVSGVTHADAGEITLDGRPVTVRGPHDAQALGISTVHQDLALCENLDVVANLFLGHEERRFTWLRELRMERTARDLLASLDVRIPEIRTPSRRSPAVSASPSPSPVH